MRRVAARRVPPACVGPVLANRGIGGGAARFAPASAGGSREFVASLGARRPGAGRSSSRAWASRRTRLRGVAPRAGVRVWVGVERNSHRKSAPYRRYSPGAAGGHGWILPTPIIARGGRAPPIAPTHPPSLAHPNSARPRHRSRYWQILLPEESHRSSRPKSARRVSSACHRGRLPKTSARRREPDCGFHRRTKRGSPTDSRASRGVLRHRVDIRAPSCSSTQALCPAELRFRPARHGTASRHRRRTNCGTLPPRVAECCESSVRKRLSPPVRSLPSGRIAPFASARCGSPPRDRAILRE